MGIPIIPPTKADPGKECLTCFDPGETPEIIWCMIAGIATGPIWFPALPPPPNGIYPLTVVNKCLWFGGVPDFEIGYAADLPGSFLQVRWTAGFWFWNGVGPASCEAWFDLIADGNLAPFYTDGFGLLAFPGDCPLISLEELALSVGLHPGPKLSAHGWPKAGQEAVIQYIDVPEDTGIKILYDCS